MQQRIGWILSTALIVGCTAQSPSAPDATTPPAASTAANAAPTIGVDLAGIDKSVKPGTVTEVLGALTYQTCDQRTVFPTRTSQLRWTIRVGQAE